MNMRVILTILLLVGLLGVPTLRATPIISEFMAINDTGLNDEDGDAEDWIEIQNTGLTTVDLAGWHLTDDAGVLTKWIFPSVSLDPGEYLVVFASGKDRRISGSELHTNFKLAGEGEFLALVMPDGTTQTSSFDPAYPPQFVDISYGSSAASTATQILVEEGDSAKAIVPDAAYDSSVGTTWRNDTPGFDESGWSSGALGVGYDTQTTYDSDIGLDVELEMNGTNGSVYIRIPFEPIPNPDDVIELTLRMKYDDGFAAFINGTPVAEANAPATPLWNSFATTSHGDDVAQIFVDYDITAFSGSLSSSTNILAIHGLNASLTSSDLLMLPQLEMRTATNISTSVGFFEISTPGTANDSATFDGVVEDTHFTVGRGFFTNTFTETFTCTEPGATLIHTLDGSAPSLSNGIITLPPDAATAPTATVGIATTTTLRVRAVKTNFIPTNVDTQTYIFPLDVVQQTGAGFPLPPHPDKSDWDYVMDPEIVNDPRFPNVAGDLLAIPTMSIVMDRDDLWGVDGIYANPEGQGFDWEAPCSVEYIRPDGGPGFQEDGGYRLQGSGSRRTSRPWSKKSMRVVFRSMYGVGKLDFPLFGEQGAQKLDNIVIRGNYFDSWTVHTEGSSEGIARKNAMVLRDEYGRKTHQDMGAETVVYGDWAHIYLNGMYWGVFNIHERPDENFAEDRFGGDKDDYDIIKHYMEIVSGDRVAWDEMIATLNGDMTDPAVYASVRQQLDVDEFADYILMNIYGGNNDWPHNNWYVMRHRPSNSPFTFVAWDVEHYIFLKNEFGPINRFNDNSPGYIWGRLRQNPEFLLYFADRVHKHMFNGGALSPEKCSARFTDIVDTVFAAMNAEAARWGDNYNDISIDGNPLFPAYNTADHYSTVVADKVDNYFPIRTSVVFNNLRNSGLYPDTDAPEFSQHGGQVPVDYLLSISNPDGVGSIYYTTNGTDPRLTGGNVSPDAIGLSSLTVSSPVHVKARIINIGEPGSNEIEWSALTEATFVTAPDPLPGDIVVSELHYHPAPPTPGEALAGFLDEDDFEYIELLNVSTGAVDLSGARLDGAVALNLGTLPDPADRLLLPDEYLLLAEDADAIAERYGTNIHVAGVYDGKLNNGGETFDLLLDTLPLISFTYNDKSPWPESPDGDGPSLVLRAPDDTPDHNDPFAWRPSAFFGGTPGSNGPVEPAFPANPGGDDNANGIPDVVDYAIAQPLYWSVLPGNTGTPARVSFSKNLLADQARASVASSTNLIDWADLPVSNGISEVHHNDGTATYSLRLNGLAETNDTLFLKLQLQ